MNDWNRLAGCLALFALIGLVSVIYFGVHAIAWLLHHRVVPS